MITPGQGRAQCLRWRGHHDQPDDAQDRDPPLRQQGIGLASRPRLSASPSGPPRRPGGSIPRGYPPRGERAGFRPRASKTPSGAVGGGTCPSHTTTPGNPSPVQPSKATDVLMPLSRACWPSSCLRVPRPQAPRALSGFALEPPAWLQGCARTSDVRTRIPCAIISAFTPVPSPWRTADRLRSGALVPIIRPTDDRCTTTVKGLTAMRGYAGKTAWPR